MHVTVVSGSHHFGCTPHRPNLLRLPIIHLPPGHRLLGHLHPRPYAATSASLHLLDPYRPCHFVIGFHRNTTATTSVITTIAVES